MSVFPKYAIRCNCFLSGSQPFLLIMLIACDHEHPAESLEMIYIALDVFMSIL